MMTLDGFIHLMNIIVLIKRMLNLFMILHFKHYFLILKEFLILWRFIILKDDMIQKLFNNKNKLSNQLNKDNLILFKEAMQ